MPTDGPTCSHGPMLKIVDQTSRSFHYACSAFRDKSECEKQDLYQSSTLRNWSSEDILGISQSDRAYCYTCDCLFSLSLSGQKHEVHEYRKNLSDNLLGMPSYLLKPLENSKAHASSFYHPHRYSRYNMVNGFFFSRTEEENFHHFIKNNIKPDDKCSIFCDPPFSAPLSLIVKQINSIIQYISSFQSTAIYDNYTLLVTKNNCKSLNQNDIPYLLVLPFFFEKKLQKIAPFLNLLDYKYNDLFLTFRFCEICQRYSHITNLHCPKCDRCTTKHGPTYVHCDKCNRCRPAKKFHCDQCKHCVSINQCVHQSKRKKLSYNTSDNL
ncbi:unnamed protein product [Schistosoma mattheei]|uniref:CTCHY-type domain-containing protein n=1 Tax=Schistosoma mattheei TaxID=31246 RepID=A0A3P8EHB0_9TREM|nr:unnamed protein product [Schistosoma mattheei]